MRWLSATVVRLLRRRGANDARLEDENQDLRLRCAALEQELRQCRSAGLCVETNLRHSVQHVSDLTQLSNILRRDVLDLTRLAVTYRDRVSKLESALESALRAAGDGREAMEYDRQSALADARLVLSDKIS